MKRQSNHADFNFTDLSGLFTTEQERIDAKKSIVEELPVEKLTEFPGHPFHVKEDDELNRLMDSVQETGVLTPAIVRPMEDGSYQVISGHRRLIAAQKLGLETLPAIVREMDDDEAVVAMVDANLQREHVLPSEKAFAYKMKLEAISRQGRRSDLTSCQVGTKLRSDEKIAEYTDDSARQIQRYIRLTNLIPCLLDMVDTGKIAFSPAVELSYLTAEQQQELFDAMERNDCTPSHAQAIRLKKAAQAGTLDGALIQSVMAEEKPNQVEKVKLRRDELEKFFPPSFTDEQIRTAIFKGLELWQRQQQRSRRDAR